MEFRTAYGEKLKNWSPSGEKTEMRHRASMDKNGVRTLIRDRKVPIYDLIQESRDECEIERIIQRAVMGDANALNQSKGVYADITGMPKSIAEAQQMIINMKEEFEHLPKEIRAKFENNAEMYVAEFGSDGWFEKTGLKEKIEKEALAKAQKTEFDKNLTQAVANLAQGNQIKQTEVAE